MQLGHPKIHLLRATLLLALLVGATHTPAQAAGGAVTWPAPQLRLIALGLTRPVYVTHAGDGSGRLFLVEKAGHILVRRDGEVLAKPFLDIRARVNATCGECGLLSVAFPPDYAASGVFYVYYNAKEDLVPGDNGDPNGLADSMIARFHVTADPDVADPDSEEPILRQNQPAENHNGGLIAFGPDGHLYIGLGDGGGGGDAFDNGQNPKSLLGKLLRIHVTGSGPYTIPDDNPFVDNPNYRPEIWATGLRNPWRYAWDPATGDLYIADVGQGDYEEINVQPANSPGGENYGWPITEGKHCYAAATCDTDGLTAPVAEYIHDTPNDDNDDCSVTGGAIFTSQAAVQAPVYLYGDFCSGRIRGLQRDGALWVDTILLGTGLSITSFGVDEAGHVFVAAYNGGSVYRLFEPLAIHYLPMLSTD